MVFEAAEAEEEEGRACVLSLPGGSWQRGQRHSQDTRTDTLQYGIDT